jgi:hypothetical protein
MSNRIALILGGLILTAFALDLILGWGGTLFLAQKFANFIEWLAFWR